MQYTVIPHSRWDLRNMSAMTASPKNAPDRRPERFDLSALDRPRAEMIGYELAELDPASRSSLVAQCKAVDVSTYH